MPTEESSRDQQPGQENVLRYQKDALSPSPASRYNMYYSRTGEEPAPAATTTLDMVNRSNCLTNMQNDKYPSFSVVQQEEKVIISFQECQQQLSIWH